MPKVVGVRCKRAGRVYYFDATGHDLKLHDPVVVETSRGLEIGRVIIAPEQVLESELTEPLKPIMRRAEPEDLRQRDEYRSLEQEAIAKAQERVRHFRLPMKLLSAEHNLDGTRLTFYFTAEGRVDFRELVRDLAATFRTRVELRQVGARDEAKILGGLGRCGQALCCASFLCDFATVSIRMAKTQDLPLGPTKISGLCGRLMCCLSYENEQYRLFKEKLPPFGQSVPTPEGPAIVVGANPLKDTVTLQLESQTRVELPLADLAAPEAKPTKGERPKG